MFKILIISFLLSFCLYANDQKITNSFVDDLLAEVSNTLDANVADKIKLQNIEKYLSNLELDDKVNTKKYIFNIMGHHENYMLFAGHSSSTITEKHWDVNGNRDVSRDYERYTNEAQFQLSIKVPLYNNFLNS